MKKNKDFLYSRIVIYKCRLCGATIKQEKTCSFSEKPEDPLKLSLTGMEMNSPHKCSDKTCGVTDFIGVKEIT